MATTLVVVLGAGQIGPRHAELVLKNPLCSLFAIVDRSKNGPGVARACNTRHFNNVHEMLTACETEGLKLPDAAIICTPNSSHAELGSLLASKGVHLLMEKPMASLADECRALMKDCQAHGVQLLIGHHRRFNPLITRTKELMLRIGRPIAVQGVWAQRKSNAYYNEKAWRRSRTQGGGAMLINLIHDLDLLQYLLGLIVKVYAEQLLCQRPPDQADDQVDEGAVLTLKFGNGCCGTFVCSDNVVSPFGFEAGTGENPLIPQCPDLAGLYRIFGSRGTISVPDLTLYHQDHLDDEDKSWWKPVTPELLALPERKSEHTEARAGLSSQSLEEANLEPFDYQLQHFLNLITGAETVCRCTGDDALRALLCIEAVLRSIETGLPQAVAQY